MPELKEFWLRGHPRTGSGRALLRRRTGRALDSRIQWQTAGWPYPFETVRERNPPASSRWFELVLVRLGTISLDFFEFIGFFRNFPPAFRRFSSEKRVSRGVTNTRSRRLTTASGNEKGWPAGRIFPG